MIRTLVLLVCLLGGEASATCYVPHGQDGNVLYEDEGVEAPFSVVLPPSAEAEASRARGEYLMMADRECDTVPVLVGFAGLSLCAE